MYSAQKSNKNLSSWGLVLSLGLSLALSPSLTSGVAIRSLFLHQISVVRVYLSIAATTQDPAGQDPYQVQSRQAKRGRRGAEQCSEMWESG